MTTQVIADVCKREEPSVDLAEIARGYLAAPPVVFDGRRREIESGEEFASEALDEVL